MRRFLRWLAGLGEARPDPPVLTLHPYNVPTPRQQYLNAWDQVRVTPPGLDIIHTLHNNLVAELQMRCPPKIQTNEERSMWLADHEARISVLLDLTRQAVYGTKLMDVPKAKKPPQLKG